MNMAFDKIRSLFSKKEKKPQIDSTSEKLNQVSRQANKRPRGEQEKKHRPNTAKKIFFLLLASTALAALPDQQGNTQAGRLISGAVTSLLSESKRAEADSIEQRLAKATGEKEMSEAENPHYQSYVDSLKEAVEEFSAKHPNTPITWNLHEDYVGDIELADILMRPITEDENLDPEYVGKTIPELLWAEVEDASKEPQTNKLASADDLHIPWQKLKQSESVIQTQEPVTSSKGINEKIVYEIILRRLPDTVVDYLRSAELNTTQLPSSSYEKFKKSFDPKKHLQIIDRMTLQPGSTKINEVMAKRLHIFYAEIKSDLEALYTDNNEKPLSTSQVLLYLLEKNQGDLNSSMTDLAGFYKYMIRGDGDTLQGNIPWMKEHILDQVNKKFSLNELPDMDQLSPEDRMLATSMWGLMYHEPHIFALESILAPSFIRAATAGEYAIASHVASGAKERADINAMHRLEDGLEFLTQFSR